MNKLIHLSKYFLKKNLKDIVLGSIILLISTTLFSSAIMINLNINEDYDKESNKLNTASSFFTIAKYDYNDDLLNDIKKIKGIKDAEAIDSIMLNVPVKIGSETQEQTQLFYNISNKQHINKRTIIKENKDITNGIYLTNYTYIQTHLDLLDEYKFQINDSTYSFKVKGVISEMQFGNYTSSVIGEYLDNDAYNYLLENNLDKCVTTISVISDNNYDSYQDVSKYLSKKNINIITKNYKEQSKNQRLAISNILVLILSIFAISILIISLLVSKFKIQQTIEEEIANMGTLKALGYSSHEIITSCTLPYIINGFIFTTLGIILSYFLLPLLALVIEMQSGFIWKINIDIQANILVLIINMTLITIFTYIAALKIKKLNPINAIRGIANNKVSKNHFEIEKTKGNINFILMLKNFVQTKKQNILLGIVLLFITIISSFIGILFYNVNVNPINFINTLVEEHPSVIITTNKDIVEDLRKEDNVKNIIYYDENGSVNYIDNSYKTFVANTFDSLANDLCYEGTNPKNDLEVSIGSNIKEKYNIKLGDYITLKKNEKEFNYKVVGFIQSVNYSGDVIEMTTDGYKNINQEYKPNSIYIYLSDENKSKEFINTIKEKYKNIIESTLNYQESMDSAITMYVSLVSIVCIIIIVITILLIYLILYIVISSIIMKRKQELGIFKALGYKNKELVINLIGGFIPSIIIGTSMGVIINILVMNQIYNKIFRLVGAYKVSFEYPVIIYIGISLIIAVSTLTIAYIVAKKIKKISVYSLIKD